MKMVVVDCNYVLKEYASSYLLIENGHGFFIECNTSYAIPDLIKAAREHGIPKEKVDGLLITHVHLDHAGGAGVFLREFPNAKLYAHPRAAKHAIDPARLIASATQVYGEKFMKETYGEIAPAPAERVVILNDGDTVSFQGKHLNTKHVRGHANHHLVAVDSETKTIFTGDAFGVSYPEINREKGMVILPSTSPTDFDAEAAMETVKWIRDHAEHVGLTHFGFLNGEEIAQAAAQLIDQLQFSESLRASIVRENLDEAQVRERLKAFTFSYFEERGVKFDRKEQERLNLDLEINAQGLFFKRA